MGQAALGRGATLSTVGRAAASPASTHWMPVAPPNPTPPLNPRFNNQKCAQEGLNVWGGGAARIDKTLPWLQTAGLEGRQTVTKDRDMSFQRESLSEGWGRHYEKAVDREVRLHSREPK